MIDDNNNPREGLFSHTDDFNTLSNVTKKYPSIQEIVLRDKAHYDSLIEMANNDKDIIPLFIKNEASEIEIISSHNKDVEEIGENCHLVYLGKPFDVEEVANEEA